MNYKESGVNIDLGNSISKFVSEEAKKTFSKSVLNGIGSFNALFSLRDIPNWDSYQDPVIVSSTDGVGTKLKVASLVNYHYNVGYDLVGMCVNDILTCGATPLFFLDYFASSKIDETITKIVLTSIADACKFAGCSLIGGETAELPGVYQNNEYDLAGFAVGIVDRKNIIDGTTIKTGDTLIGIPSKGLHSNGFSLVRKIFNKRLDIMGKFFLKPTRIYTPTIIPLLKTDRKLIKGMVHITGGGTENILRVLPRGLGATIFKSSWKGADIFRVIQKEGNVPEEEMYRVFNMGIGFVLVVSPEDTFPILSKINIDGARIVGKVTCEEGIIYKN